jgi:CubicO group peptidase (beta-lactamase class C family)
MPFSSLPVPTHTTSLLVLQEGRTVLELGNTGRASYVASVRKSLLSILYGVHVASGVINLDATIGTLGITDVGGLLEVEETARVRDLLTSRSGVYHAPSSPGSHEDGFPPRGTTRPGQHFVYNNWDFNVAGAVFEKATGQSVFAAFESQLARPLGFQDYDPSRQRMLGDRGKSLFPAYHFFLSARDLAKVGLLMAGGGEWAGRRLVPLEWVRESLQPHVSRTDMPAGTGFGDSDYGYLWWLPAESDQRWEGAFLAAGNFGQYVLVLPAVAAVIVHRRYVGDGFAVARNTGSPPAVSDPQPVSHGEFMRLARALVDIVLRS